MIAVKTSIIQLRCTEQDLAPYIGAVADAVYHGYDGGQSQWALVDSMQLWKISLGGRAGVLGVHMEGRSCCVKLFYDQRAWTRLRVRLGLAKARRAYRYGLRLERLGIRSPRMLGYAEQRPGQLPLIVMELVTEAVRLDHWISSHGVSRPLVESVARFIRHLHDMGVTHIDLSPRNLMVGPAGKGFNVWLLDCEDARFRRAVPERLRLANLHHLDERLLCCVSIRDRLRFLRAYTGQKDSPWREVLGRMIEGSRSKYVREYREHLRSRSRPAWHN